MVFFPFPRRRPEPSWTPSGVAASPLPSALEPGSRLPPGKRRFVGPLALWSTPRRRRLTVAFGAIAALFLLAELDALFPPPLDKLERASPVVLDRHGAWLRALPVEDGRWRLRADLSHTDPVFLRRLVAMEDRRFETHSGVDPLAIVRAAGRGLLTGHLRSGGSTISMQIARRLDPRPRTLGAKIIEAIRAVQLEARFSKRQLLADYLTLTPYGGSLEGLRAASLAYFGHEPTTLTDSEQALLIALPQAPEARRPDRRYGAALRSRAAVLRKLARMKLISPEAAKEAAGDPIPHRRSFPASAFSVSAELAQAAPKAQPTVVSTLDANLQRRLEGYAALAAVGQGNSSSVAVLVIDTKTRAVRAAVTSAGRARPGGWVDATRALRSPGSALKPFVYALAFEQGIAAPDTRIADSPTAFADYRPEDFDKVFHGPVTARQALQYSLNVPAVTLLSKIGPEAFDARLHNVGVDLVRPQEATTEAGLPLALGGAGLTLRDLAMLYAALGDGGVAKRLAWTEAEAAASTKDHGRRLVRADAAEKVLAVLRESPPPADRPPPALSVGAPPLAFKTGTSYGFRDAVAAGVGDGYAIVVWTGRPDGGARQGMTGRAAALPLLFQCFDALEAQSANPRALPPPSAPRSLAALEDAKPGPKMIFPPDGARVIVDRFGAKGRGLTLAASGDALRWYVDGAPLPADDALKPVWRPNAPGFYRITAVDERGQRSQARIRVTAN